MAADEHLSGQFTTLYHGTSATKVEGIKAKGLAPPAGVMPSRWYMLTSSREQAARYGQGTVMEYRLPPQAMDYRHPEGVVWPGQEHNVYGYEGMAYGVKGAVPSEYLHDVHEEAG